ncbi:unnamed protein product [Toxocara canis]|uniref:Cytochrome P450 n=1 Tax=Toxocara canis TaxID=6265 RepID=A0A183VHJ9_TOXCA|nr:unnamed protein product [Toxocara canis]
MISDGIPSDPIRSDLIQHDGFDLFRFVADLIRFDRLGPMQSDSTGPDPIRSDLIRFDPIRWVRSDAIRFDPKSSKPIRYDPTRFDSI